MNCLYCDNFEKDFNEAPCNTCPGEVVDGRLRLKNFTRRPLSVLEILKPPDTLNIVAV